MGTEESQLHEALVESLRDKGLLTNPRVDAAFCAVPRHLFLPGMPLEEVYADNAIAIKKDDAGMVVSSSSQPTMMALMIDQLGLGPGQNVLEVGTATGYNAAIMQHIVGDEGHVTTLEIDEDLAQQAAGHLREAGYEHVDVVADDGAAGYPANAPYDCILATVGLWDVPPSWRQQLKPGGVLVAPMWLDGVQVSATFTLEEDGSFYSQHNSPCAFVYLRGAAAGPGVIKRIGSTALYILADEVDKIDTAALHMLLSDDYEQHHLGLPLSPPDYWYGIQLYLMLNEPPGYIFAVFSVIGSQKVYGVDGRGIALFAPGSAVFIPYESEGLVHCYAGADAYLALQETVDEWDRLGRPAVGQLRLRLMPRMSGTPRIKSGKLYTRRDHNLHVWLES